MDTETKLRQRIAALRGALGAISFVLRREAPVLFVADIADGSLIDDDKAAAEELAAAQRR